MNKRQQKNEQFAKLCEEIGGKNSVGAREFRAANRRIDKARRRGHRSKP